jgi:prepilin-type N-terminal cleavage/methylation domain-containing protein
MNKKAFTLIELLLVVSILSILSGITISVINTKQKSNQAKDTVIRSNLEKIVTGVEAHCNTERYCPALNAPATSTSILMTVYLLSWPTDATYSYTNNGSDAGKTNGTAFEIYVPLLSYNPIKYLKYKSTEGKIKECSTTNIATYGICEAYKP